MTATAELSPAATQWQIDPAHTHVEFAVKHLMISTVKGRFGDVAGVVSGDLLNPAAASLDVTLGVASIDTRQEQRDAHLRSPDFFDSMKWPTIRFVGRKAKGDLRGDFSLIGDLTIRDVTREVTLEVTNEGTAVDPWGGSRAGYSAKARINRRDFGLTYNQALETGGFVVGDEIRISVDVELTAVKAAVAA